MATLTTSTSKPIFQPLPKLPRRGWKVDAIAPLMKYVPMRYGMPILYEDDLMVDIGESIIHTETEDTLFLAIRRHFSARKGFQVYRNLNLDYPELPDYDRWLVRLPHVSPDIMVTTSRRPLDKKRDVYRIGKDGPVPPFLVEVLSERSDDQRDLSDKADLYAQLGVAEYLLVDLTGHFLKKPLLLLTREATGDWRVEIDGDRGVVSRLGFRIQIEDNGRLRVVNAKNWPTDSKTGRPTRSTSSRVTSKG